MTTLMQLFNNKKKSALLVLILLVGVLLVLFSGENKSEKISQTNIEFDEEEYEEILENRLTSILEKIDGVGEVSVMVTLEGSALYSYATDTSQDNGKEGNSKKESTIVLSTKSSSVKEAVISGYTLPKVKGAAVVCSSDLSATLRAKVIGVVSAALGISSARICVTN